MNVKFNLPAHVFLGGPNSGKKVFIWVGQTASGIHVESKCDGKQIECEIDFVLSAFRREDFRRLVGALTPTYYEIAFASEFAEAEPNSGVCKPTDAVICGNFHVEAASFDLFSPKFSEPRIKIKLPLRAKAEPLFSSPSHGDVFLELPSYSY